MRPSPCQCQSASHFSDISEPIARRGLHGRASKLSKEGVFSAASSLHCCICPDTSTSSSERLLRQISFPETKRSPHDGWQTHGTPSLRSPTASCIASLDPLRDCWRHHHLRT